MYVQERGRETLEDMSDHDDGGRLQESAATEIITAVSAAGTMGATGVQAYVAVRRDARVDTAAADDDDDELTYRPGPDDTYRPGPSGIYDWDSGF